MCCRGLWLGTLLLCLFAAGPAHAHHLWVERGEEDYHVRRGLIPDRIDAFDPRHVTKIKAFDAQGLEFPVQRTDGAKGVRVGLDQDPALITVTCEWGHRVNTPVGKRFMSKQEALDHGVEVLSAFTSTQYSKTFFSIGDTWTLALGLPMEIVPLALPESLAPGEALPVKVLFNGSPLADSVIKSTLGHDDVKTDNNGLALIPLGKNGLHAIFATHTVSDQDKDDIDYRQHMTFIVFTLPCPHNKGAD